MQLNPYLMFAGDCAAAFRFYQRCLGGEIIAMLSYRDTPACGELAEDWQDKIAHAQLKIGANRLMGSDAMPGYQETPRGFSVTLNIADAREAERTFNALADNGTIRMPLEETFWALRFGTLVDQFGTPWMVNCEKPDGSSA